MNIRLSHFLRRFGLGLILVSLIASSTRYYALEGFKNGTPHDFMAPSSEIFHPSKTKFSFSIISDTGARNEPIQRILKRIRHSKSEFILHLGDLVQYRTDSHFRWITSELADKLGKLQLYAVPGNHEILKKDGKSSLNSYTKIFGQPYYWFAYGHTLFIALDSSEGKIDDKQFEWLRHTLKKIRPLYQYCILYSHVPPVNPGNPGFHTLDSYSRERLAEIISPKEVDAMFFGHVHNFQETEFVGIPTYTLPSSGQVIRSKIKKFGYVDVRMDANGIIKAKPRYVEGGDDVEFWESFASNALVKEGIHTFSLWSLGIGLLLTALSFLRRRN